MFKKPVGSYHVFLKLTFKFLLWIFLFQMKFQQLLLDILLTTCPNKLQFIHFLHRISSLYSDKNDKLTMYFVDLLVKSINYHAVVSVDNQFKKHSHLLFIPHQRTRSQFIIKVSLVIVTINIKILYSVYGHRSGLTINLKNETAIF